MQSMRFRAPSGAVRTGRLEGEQIHFGERTYDVDAVDVLPPVEPTKIVCQAGGYREHREEAERDLPDRPDLFLKAPNAVASHGDAIPIPEDRRIDYEAEFAVVVDTQCRNVSADEAMDVVRGFTCANDLSNRDDQAVEQNWVRGKAFDHALPVGPAVATPDEVPQDATLELRVNGAVEQSASRDMLLFSVPELIEAITSFVTLEPGDLVVTGTPEGPGPLADGDEVEIEFEGVGTLAHTVVAE